MLPKPGTLISGIEKLRSLIKYNVIKLRQSALMIGILDLKSGNLRSVANSVYELGFDYIVLEDKNHMDDITHLIIPGVGHYYTAINHLNETGLIEVLNQFYESKRPILGICLGMQLLSSIGHEGGVTTGLNFIPGIVQRFAISPPLRIPHIGWNTVSFQKQHPVFEGIKDKRDYYFVHSYHYICEEENHVLGTTEYGTSFPSIINKQHVIGLQFHPEKSQKNGLALLENFCNWDGLC
ncbi:TPA: imidazole glycerol phosphate synthase subunit HisH [Legionella pneumophila]|nr:imidazole glycerol phosphate synthase subunit HisH [Legionella pneumophila]